MCTISDKLKLCTCKDGVENLEHYWVLRRGINNGYNIVGEILPPLEIGKELDKLNINTIQKLLNEGYCFDVDLNLQDDDSLILYFTCNNDQLQYPISGNYLAYSFVYKNSKWKAVAYEPIQDFRAAIQKGKLLNPFEN